MKNNFTTFIKFFLFIIIIISSLSVKNLYSINSKDMVVFLTAEVTKTPTPSIKINWQTTGYAKEYSIYRKVKESNYWGNEIAHFDSSASSYIDFNVNVGEAYEYQVLAYSQIPDAVLDTLNYFATGYIYAGIEVMPDATYGTVLLLIESNIEFYFLNKINRLKDDLIAEGWNVTMKYSPRSDSNGTVSPTAVRNIIKQEYAKDNSINTVFIFGRIAVPYSGNFRPDAHSNHQGAWPADVYYGVFDDNFWTDNYINTDYNGANKPSRKENENRPGDGKFDQSSIMQGGVNLRIGRVDFYNMPAFSKTEYELLESYLDKDHDYRTGEMPIIMRGLVDINFQPSTQPSLDYLEMNFGASGWRNFAPFFGYDSIKNVDWFNTLKNETYLWAYGCGGGNYDRAGGIGITTNFADTTQKNAIFTMMFGSYFGDWDSQNNFLRAGLCSNPSILTCSWAGRPQWYLHHMALGMPIGYSAKLSQNNDETYIPNICYTPDYPNGAAYTSSNLGVHVALMGDPTLRMYMGTVASPNNMSVIQPAGEHVEISWEKSDNNGEYSYNIYISTSKDGPFNIINEDLQTDTNFTDPEIRDGLVYYMVRAYKIQNTLSGSFYNSGRGIMKSILATEVNEQIKTDNSLAVSPNPATTNVNIELSLEKDAVVSINIYDINGNRVVNVCLRNLAGGTHSFAWNMLNQRNQKVNPGVYFIRLTGIGFSDAVKLIVMP